jgi:hypothetical protein
MSGSDTETMFSNQGAGANRRRALPLALITKSIAVASLLAFHPSLGAATVRVTFLTERAAVKDTLTVLRSSGCTQESLGTFQRAIERYASSSFDFDFSKFPKSRDGFYAFESTSALVAALPHPLADIQHAYEFNCFDTVIALAGDSLRTTVRPDAVSGPYLVPYTPTNGSFAILPRATARDAFTLAYSEWYREATEDALPKSMRDARVSLTASLFRSHLLPQSTTEGGLARGVMEALQTSWTNQGMSFPRRFEVVLCHEVNLPQRWFVTAHAGLLFPRERGLTYIEKAGGRGPFVRLDFDDRVTLLAWFGGMFQRAGKLGYTHHFATFNDTKIEMVERFKK